MQSTKHRQFVERFLREQQKIYGYIVTLVPSRADAEEIFQETSILLWEKWDEFDESRDLMPWACGIAHNVLRNHLRKKRPQSLQLDEPYLERIAAARLTMEPEIGARHQALSECMKKLPAAQRTLVEDCYGGTQSMQNLAGQLGLSPNAIYLKLRRIRAVLLECINRRIEQGGAS